MTCLLNDNVQLVDLPDELILMIMNKVKPKVSLLCSIIAIGNNRLEQLALDKCHSIDLTIDYFQSPYESLMTRFYTHVAYRIIDNIQSLTLNIRQIPDIVSYVEKNSNGILPNLIHLKIMIGRQSHRTGTPYTLDASSMEIYRVLHSESLSCFIPQFVRIEGSGGNRIISTVRCSTFMRSIVSLELENDCILPNIINPDGLFFPQSIRLSRIQITLNRFGDCVRLLTELGTQLCSFAVSIVHVYLQKADIISQISSISCPNLKQLTVTIYKNIVHYSECIVPLLQRLSNVERLTLLFAINITTTRLGHFVTELDLEKDIVSYMPHLCQFNFHIRSILENASPVEIGTFRQSVMTCQQAVICTVDYFNNNYGQCQLYSLPFIGNRLDFISNRFPLFDMNNMFSMVTMLLLFDDVKPFENLFFARIACALPNLKTLEVFNKLEQQEKGMIATSYPDFSRLSALILLDIHMDYAEQLLCRSRLPCLTELAIHEQVLLTIVARDSQQARDNCSKVENILTSNKWCDSIDAIRNFFPLVSH
ncbi:unnamed protein product [Rotaria magnacalcarata]|uniref:F-box domain-containing protein n=4 Tax=Rotaria magnacalcarata TaxID=392030 RepID=A0A815CD53_9BILA|nr:unnamed protein product [Rotaria magnacalcarata]CAF1285626.1 unnamed protein product [Rotaria magnacalcarata]